MEIGKEENDLYHFDTRSQLIQEHIQYAVVFFLTIVDDFSLWNMGILNANQT